MTVESLPPQSVGTSPLARALAAGEPRAAAFFPPPDLDAIAAGAAHRHAVADVLAEQNRAWDAPESVLARAERLRDPRAVAVVTGQQLGLFAGPLYTVYKALTAVRAAAQIEAETGRAAVPVFWLADEDHDYAEVRSATFTDGADVRTVAYDPGLGPRRPPVGRITLDARRLAATREALGAALRAGQHRADVLDAVDDAYRPGRTLRDAFARLLARLAPGLVLASADDVRLKRLVAPLFLREIDTWEATFDALDARSRELVAAGFHAQVAPAPLNLFWTDDAGDRRPLDPAEGGLACRGDAPEPTDVWRARVAAHPERVSPNVVLRPLMQDTLFPTAAYVAGPGEQAYFAQLGPVYAAFGVPMPAVVPRGSATLVEPGVAKVLDRYGLGVPDVRPPLDALFARLAAEASGVDLAGPFDTARAEAEAALAPLAPLVAGLDPSHAPAAEAARVAIVQAVERLRATAARLQKRRHADVGGRLARAQAALWPGGTLQERILSPLQIAARHGFDALPVIVGALPLDGASGSPGSALHHVVRL